MPPPEGSRVPQVTLQDLADRLGVARSTVSRALRDDRQIGPATRARVQQLASEVGYRPNLAARTLIRRRAEAIGLMLPRTSRFVFGNPYFHELLEGVASVAEPLGWPLVVWTDVEPDPAAWLRGARVDGVIALGQGLRPRDAAALDALHREGRAVVLVHPPAVPCAVPYVATDELPGIADAVARLHDLGHRRAALLTGPQDWRYARERAERWRHLADEAGIAVARDDVVAANDGFEDAGRATRALARSGRLGRGAATVLIAGNDLMALGAWDALRELGLEAPDDVSLVGFDDVPAARWAGLASVRQCARELGAAAMARLARRLGVTSSTVSPTLTSAFVPRRSVGPAP
ncbi:MAG: LacI family DNA-binding transcriptional regulator [Trueperaceae bacterium]